ncbi:MAG: hypothetical protein M1837_003924 [Sclerophora amabilis]|nr:MAG: hypothetical protein M1837_003924 [Sclerophora amabilis]
MPLKDLLRKKDKIKDDADERTPTSFSPPPAPAEFTFMRSTTTTQEILAVPSFQEQSREVPGSVASPPASPTNPKRPQSRLRALSSASITSIGGGSAEGKPGSEKRLSQRLHLRSSSRSASRSSIHVPEDLPNIEHVGGGAPPEGSEDYEAQWEQRATLLAKGTAESSRPVTPQDERIVGRMAELSAGETVGQAKRRSRSRSVSDQRGDENIQEAIRLHETGDLQRSTAMFGRLADPGGANNALSQVLYGLALRHGWGTQPSPQSAVHYLTLAASNSADIESLALQAGMKKGGAAKGELVLAIFELANCFRQGWGVERDPVAAKQYYETAANLGDTDAMNEVAWCYLEGFGCKKDKVAL